MFCNLCSGTGASKHSDLYICPQCGGKGVAREKYSFHFSLGNSGSGPIGLSAQVAAEDHEDAVDRLHQFLPREYTLFDDGEEYVTIFFNEEYVTSDDIDEFEPLDEEEAA